MTKTNFTFFHPMSRMKLRESGSLLLLLFTFLLGSSALSAQSTPTIPNPYLPKLSEKAVAFDRVYKESRAIMQVLQSNPDLNDPAVQANAERYSTLTTFLGLLEDKNFGVQKSLAFMNMGVAPEGQHDYYLNPARHNDWNRGVFNDYVDYVVEIIKE